ncbi:MAG: flagellar biosynthesis regulator FlaF [Thiobacillus sp.]
MSPEQPIQQAPRRIKHTDVILGEVVQLDGIAAQLMAVQRYWNEPDHERHLAAALDASRHAWHAIQDSLAEGALTLPLDVQQNLLILSVYADSKISLCEAIPSTDTLGSLIALTRTLAGSLKEWRVAA